MKDKEVFDFFDRFLEGDVSCIKAEDRGARIVSKSSADLLFGRHAEIEWTHESSKQYPPPEPEFLPVPEWLKNWTPDTKVMVDSGGVWCSCLLSHIDCQGFVLGVCKRDIIAPYNPLFLGNEMGYSEQIHIYDLKKMNPEELSHIPGVYYKPQHIHKYKLEDFGLSWKDLKASFQYVFIQPNGNLYIGDKAPILDSRGWLLKDGNFILIKTVKLPKDADWRDLLWERK
jgi:hypothetical protein